MEDKPMRTIMLGFAAAGLLGGCSEPAAEKPAETRAEALQPGEYELTETVTELRSTDNSTPATSAKVGPARVLAARVCVTAEGIPPAAFAMAGETCTPLDSYMRGGRMSLQFKCNRSGRGALTQTVDGTFTADSFDAKIITGTIFSGDGDYAMTRAMTGRRVGDCAAQGETKQ
jgi:hypothetical protein